MRKFFSSIQVIVLLALATLLIFATITSFIEPIHIHIFAFTGFFYPLFWILNIGALIFLLARRRWILTLIPIFAVILTINSWNSVFQFSKKEKEISEMEEPIKIISYNTRMFDYYKHSGMDGAPDVIFDALLKENADIICFQEYFTTLAKEPYKPNSILAKFRHYKYKHIEYLHTRKGNAGYGLAIFSKYPIVNSGAIRFEKSNNLSQFSDITVNNKKIRLFNNHLESIGFKEDELSVLDSLDFRMTPYQKEGLRNISNKLNRAFSLRSKQAEAISRHIKNSPYPVIVCGDFNDTPVSYTYRKMKKGLRDAFIESGSGFSGTYNGQLPSFRIDYIFHDAKFNSYNYKRMDLEYSDHFPIMTTIDLGK